MPMIEKMVQTAKQTVNAIVDIHKALACPAGAVFDEPSIIVSVAGRFPPPAKWVKQGLRNLS
jgi:hypothetical protein